VTHLSPDERQALREKHADNEGFCKTCIYESDYSTYSLDYPCDTIKVLDAWEADKCDHKTVLNGVEKTWWFSCPKCNEML